MPARSHDNQESSFNGLSSGQRAKRVEAPQRVPRAPPGPSQPSVGSLGFPAAGDSGEPVAGGDGRVRQSQQGLRGFNSDESIRDVLAQRDCRVLWLRSSLYLFTAYLTGADAVAGQAIQCSW